MATTTVEYVDIENNPFTSQVEPGLIDHEYADLPREFLAELGEIYARLDSVRCARCADPVGFVVRVQSSGSDGLEWTPCGLARDVDHPEHVVVLCELCTPFVPKPEAGAR